MNSSDLDAPLDEIMYFFDADKDETSQEYETSEISVFIYEPGYVNLFPLFFGSIK